MPKASSNPSSHSIAPSLAHQWMALAIQHQGVARSDAWAWIDGAAAFASITEPERAALLEYMLSTGILADNGGRLWLGEKGEEEYGHGNFRKLYAVFDAPQLMTVRWASHEVGVVESAFLQALAEKDGSRAFVLAGRVWEVVDIDWERGLCAVTPGSEGKAPRWSGGARFLSYELCQAMRRVLVDAGVSPAWSKRAQEVLRLMRAEHVFLKNEPAPMIEQGSRINWWTFAGGAANLLLAKMLEAALGGKVISRNTSLTLEGQAAASLVAVKETLAEWRREGRPNAEDALRFAQASAKGRVGKFDACLPERIRLEILLRGGRAQRTAAEVLALDSKRDSLEPG